MPYGDYGGFFEQNSFSGFNPTLIGAVIVTYQPKVKDTLALVATISPQVGPVVIVDNGSSQQTVQALLDSCKYTGTKVIALGQNLGLAAAQNRGFVRFIPSDKKPQPISKQAVACKRPRRDSNARRSA